MNRITYKGEKIAALGTEEAKFAISQVITGIDRVSKLRGAPVFTWDMWPTGGDDHPNEQMEQ